MTIIVRRGTGQTAISRHAFIALFEASVVATLTDYERTLDTGTIKFTTLVAMARKAQIPYVLCFAPDSVVDAQVKRNNKLLLEGVSKGMLSLNSRGRVRIGDIELIVKDIGRKQVTLKRLDPDLPENTLVKCLKGSKRTVATDAEFLLAEVPDMPATVLAERVGWTGSIRWFRDNVKRLRPEHRPVDPADRLAWSPGDAAQCDLWFPPRKIPLEDGTARLLPVLVITAAHSRFMTGRMIPTRKTEDLLLGSWELLQQLGRVPRRLIWDNEPGIGRGQRRAEGVASFMGTLATRLVLLPPKDPESKGLVERRNGWFETSFMPGRSFTGPADFNEQFADWLAKANTRVVRTINAAPVDLLEADRAAMLPLPPVPLHLGWRNRVRLGRDYYVRLDTNDYSVDPHLIGRIVDVAADLHRVKVRHEGRVVTEHDRVWGRGSTISDPEHLQTAAVLRKQFQQPRVVAAGDELARDLADYDRAFGLIEGGELS